jgi:CHAD domain-containing protein
MTRTEGADTEGQARPRAPLGGAAERSAPDRRRNDEPRRRFPPGPWSRFRLRFEEPAGCELKDIARAQLLAAIERIEQDSGSSLNEETVHKTRRAITRVRGLLRLIRPAIGDRVYRAENEHLRDLNRALSGSRDSTVIIETFDKLESKLARKAGRAKRAELAHLRDELDQALRARDEPSQTPTPAPSDLIAELRTIAERIPSWPLGEDGGFELIAPGFERTYRRARKAMREAERKQDTESFHEWRKRVKHVRAQLRLLRDLHSSRVKRLIGVFEDLSDHLGVEHDLDLVDTALRDLDTRHADAAALVRKRIAKRRNKLRRRAFAAAHAGLDRKPKAITRRLERWWDKNV